MDSISDENEISKKGWWQETSPGSRTYEYRIKGIFPKQSKYIIQYSFTIDVNGKTIPLTYERQYSFDETEPYNICPGKGHLRGLDPVILGEDMGKYFSSGSILLTKTVSGLEEPGGYTFTITGPTNKKVTIKPEDFVDGIAKVEIKDLTLGTYTVKEDNAEVSFMDLRTSVSINDGEAQPGNEAVVEVIAMTPSTVGFTNSYCPAVVDKTVTKVWADSETVKDHPDVKVQLYSMVEGDAEAKPYGEAVTLSADNEWTNIWTSLPKYIDYREVTYSVKEIDIPEGYKASYSEKDGAMIITNTPTSEDGPVSDDDPPGTKTDDPSKNDDKAKDTTPNTGDSLNIVLYSSIAAIMLSAFVAVAIRRKQNRCDS